MQYLCNLDSKEKRPSSMFGRKQYAHRKDRWGNQGIDLTFDNYWSKDISQCCAISNVP